MMETAPALAAIVIVLGGIAMVSVRRHGEARGRLLRAEEDARRTLVDARRISETVLEQARLKAEGLVLQARTDHEQQIQKERLESQALEKRLLAREEAIDLRSTMLEGRHADLNKQEQSLLDRKEHVSANETELARLTAEARKALEDIAGLTREEAKRALIDDVVAEARHEAGKRARQVEEDAREEADRKAKKLISIAIERLAGDFIAERTVSVVHLPSDDMKGRIIGREGRNIRAIEAATGVDLIIDDTPEAVIVACHSPIRREIARIALERLISDGRIHPGRIEELVRRAEQDVEESVREAGQQAIFEVGVHGVHPELVKMLECSSIVTPTHRTSWMHSIEAAFILRHDGGGARYR